MDQNDSSRPQVAPQDPWTQTVVYQRLVAELAETHDPQQQLGILKKLIELQNSRKTPPPKP